MNVSPVIHLSTVPTAPIFTLGSALRWLGHDCRDRRCSQPIDALPVSLWFLRRGHPLPTYPLQAVLVVDLTETDGPPARVRRLIDKVNRCTRGETIRVRAVSRLGPVLPATTLTAPANPADRNDTIGRGYTTIVRMTLSANRICSTTMGPRFTIITGPVMRR